MKTNKELLAAYVKQIPKGLTFSEFCNKLEFAIDTDYIDDKISNSQKVNLKLMDWKSIIRVNKKGILSIGKGK